MGDRKEPSRLREYEMSTRIRAAQSELCRWPTGNKMNRRKKGTTFGENVPTHRIGLGMTHLTPVEDPSETERTNLTEDRLEDRHPKEEERLLPLDHRPAEAEEEETRTRGTTPTTTCTVVADLLHLMTRATHAEA